MSAGRRLRYSVAASLDGYIADPDGGYDWIVEEPGIDFGAYMAKIDTFVMGRGTYEVTLASPEGAAMFEGMAVYVVSTTLDPEEHRDVTVISDDVADRVAALKEEPGKDIWLFGGGVLFRTLLEAGLVDRVEVGVMPVLLGQGIPMLAGLGHTRGRGDHAAGPGPPVAGLELHSAETFGSGIVLLKYGIASD